MKFAMASLLLTIAAGGFGQPAATPAFDVADVHVSAPGTQRGGSGYLPNGRFEIRGATMLSLIVYAYGVESEKVVGGPSWLESDRFDVIAKGPAGGSTEMARAMLKTLLEDRFQLSVHNAEKPLPVYALSVRKGGPRLKENSGSEDPGCKMSVQDGAMVYACHQVTMDALTLRLRNLAPGYVDHPVVNLTGLQGAYDLTLTWTARNRPVTADDKGDAAARPSAISFFDAVAKVGLKLEPVDQPTTVIVVDRVNQKPTDNLPGVTQSLPPVPTEFEAAVVRVSTVDPSQGGRRVSRITRNEFERHGATLKELITFAFDVEASSIVNGPKWLDSDRFDVIAKAPTAVGIDTMRAMLRPLLAERFKLALHKDEEQLMPVYALTAGKHPKLKEADPSNRSGCKGVIGDGSKTYTCQNTTMAQLSERIRSAAPSYIQHPVVDSTGIQGAYDFALTWTPAQLIPGAAGPTTGSATVAAAPSGQQTVFEAVDKQLGLKLEEQKRPQPVLVIDRVERTPADN